MDAALTLRRPFPALPAAPRPDWPRIWRGVLEDPPLLARLLRKRVRLGRGSYGVVYRLAGAAVKIGCIAEAEAERQAWVHERFRRALPVWAYKPCIDLPKVVTREVCPIHGDEKLVEYWSCHCGEPMDVLVMPLAWPADEAWSDPRVRETIETVKQALLDQFDFPWDDAPRNLLRYQRRILLADFGERSDNYW